MSLIIESILEQQSDRLAWSTKTQFAQSGEFPNRANSRATERWHGQLKVSPVSDVHKSNLYRDMAGSGPQDDLH